MTPFWSFAFTGWVIPVAAAFVVLAVVLSVRAIRHAGERRLAVAAIETVRLVAILLLAATLFRPERVRLTPRTEQPLVAILTDTSGSMATRDITSTTDTLSRAAWIERVTAEKFWSPLEDRYRVAVEPFSGNAATTNGAEDSTESGTDIGKALETARLAHRDLRCVLLLSDGDWNMGEPPAAAAVRLRLAGVPVFCAVAGSDRYLPDVEFVSVSAPAYGLLDEQISIPFTIQSRLDRDVRTTVTIQGPRGQVAAKSVVIPSQGLLQDSILMTPPAAGDFTFTIGVPVEPDERIRDNNEKRFRMALRQEVLQVLVIESKPRWEYRYLHNALSRDPGVRVKCLLLHPGMETGTGADYLAAFPASRQALSGFDVVFLGDVGLDDSRFTAEHAAMLKGLVEQQGSGLVFLPGASGKIRDLVGSELGAILPVTLDTVGQPGVASAFEGRLDLTTTGRDHLLTMLASDPVRNAEVWRGLPGFYWYANVLSARPGSEVLGVHSVARNANGRIPLLVTRPCGNGKTLFLGMDSAWRWRRGVEDRYHYRFWGQVVRWMAHQRHLAQQEGIRFFYSPESPIRSQRLFLHTTVFDQSGFPLQDGTVRATFTPEGGQAETILFAAEAGGWGVFTANYTPRTSGVHRVSITCPEANRTLQATINVTAPTRERIGQPARSDVLREISSLTRGETVPGEGLGPLVEKIRLLGSQEPVEERFRLWCHPAWAGLIVVLLSVYWLVRKLLGLV